MGPVCLFQRSRVLPIFLLWPHAPTCGDHGAGRLPLQVHPVLPSVAFLVLWKISRGTGRRTTPWPCGSLSGYVALRPGVPEPQFPHQLTGSRRSPEVLSFSRPQFQGSQGHSPPESIEAERRVPLRSRNPPGDPNRFLQHYLLSVLASAWGLEARGSGPDPGCAGGGRWPGLSTPSCPEIWPEPLHPQPVPQGSGSPLPPSRAPSVAPQPSDPAGPARPRREAQQSTALQLSQGPPRSRVRKGGEHHCLCPLSRQGIPWLRFQPGQGIGKPEVTLSAQPLATRRHPPRAS